MVMVFVIVVVVFVVAVEWLFVRKVSLVLEKLT